MPFTPDLAGILQQIMSSLPGQNYGLNQPGMGPSTPAPTELSPAATPPVGLTDSETVRGQLLTGHEGLLTEFQSAVEGGTVGDFLTRHPEVTPADLSELMKVLVDITPVSEEERTGVDAAKKMLLQAGQARGVILVDQRYGSLRDFVEEAHKRGDLPANITYEEFLKRNPGLNRALTPGEAITVDATKASTTVGQRGETAQDVATRLGVPVTALRADGSPLQPTDPAEGLDITVASAADTTEQPHRGMSGTPEGNVSPEQQYPATNPDGSPATPAPSTATDPAKVDLNPNQQAYSEGGVTQLLDLLIGPKNYGGSYQRYLQQQAPLVDTVQQILSLVGGGAPNDDYANVLAGALGDYAGGKQYDNAGLSDVLGQLIGGSADTDFELAHGTTGDGGSTNLLAALRSQGYSPMRMSTMFDDKVMAHLMNEYDATVGNQPNAPSFIEWLVNSQGF